MASIPLEIPHIAYLINFYFSLTAGPLGSLPISTCGRFCILFQLKLKPLNVRGSAMCLAS